MPILTLNDSRVTHNTLLTQPSTEQSLPPPPRHNLPDFLPHLHHPYHLLRGSLLLRVLRHIGDLGPPRTPHIQLHQPGCFPFSAFAIDFTETTLQRAYQHLLPASISERDTLHYHRRVALPATHSLRRPHISFLSLPPPIRLLLHRQRGVRLLVLSR